MSSAGKWVYLKPGTTGSILRHGQGKKAYTFTEADCRYRFYAQQYPTWNGGSPANNPPTVRWHVYHNGEYWWLDDGKAAVAKELKIPSLKKEFVTLAVKGSEWEFERDWTFSGYVELFAKNNMVEHTIPAGTRVKIIDNKMRMGWYAPMEKCIVAELTPELSMFAYRTYTNGKDVEGAFIPAKEASQYLKLVTAGKAKTYWKIEDNEGKAFVDKRFTTLASIKSSLRFRYNLVNTDDLDSGLPEWAGYENYEKPDKEKGIWAVHYDHATDKELDREDMIPYVFLATLKA